MITFYIYKVCFDVNSVQDPHLIDEEKDDKRMNYT